VRLNAYMAASGILFVSHDATRTGAPIALLHFLRWFKRNGNRPFSVLLGGGGELVPNFEELANTWSIDRSHWRPGALPTRILKRARFGALGRCAQTAETRRFAAKCSPGLVYTNSIASARVLEILAPQVPILTHVHEMGFLFHTLRGRALAHLLSQTSQFIACSKATRDNLVHENAIEGTRVETIYESIPVDQVRRERSRQQVLQELRIPGDALLIVGSGTADWRKGTDLFILLAREVCQRHRRAYFAWIGGGSTLEFEHDVRVCGLTEKMRFTGAVVKPADYFAAADVFVLTSREDPYPLVCLEAAALEKPIVCFEGAGGAPEFVEEDCGFIVPYLDIMVMADKVMSLLDSPDLRIAFGSAARRKVAQRHDINEVAPRITEIIERTIACGRNGDRYDKLGS
jgi:glycosyltransferase involved in cell wall biosynthesis